MSPTGSSMQDSGATAAAVRARVFDALAHFVSAELVAVSRVRPAEPDGVMATLVAAGVDEEVALLACCHALSLPPVPEAWLAAPPSRWPPGLDASVCLRLGVVPVGPADAAQERLCLGYARIEAAVADEPALPAHRRYLMARRDQQRFLAAAGVLPPRRGSGRFPEFVAPRREAAPPVDENTSPGRVVALSRQEATVVDAAPARELRTAAPPSPFLEDEIDASELGDEGDEPARSGAPPAGSDEPTTRLPAAPALGVSIALDDAIEAVGAEPGRHAVATALAEQVEVAVPARGGDDDVEGPSPPGGPGPALRGARPRELPPLDPPVAASAPGPPPASPSARRTRPATGSHRFADGPKSLPGVGGVLDPPVPPAAGRAPAPTVATLPVRSRPARLPSGSVAWTTLRRRPALIGTASLAAAVVVALAWWGASSSSPSSSSSSIAASSGEASAASVGTSDGSGASSSPPPGVDLAARQRLHLQRAEEAPDARLAIQELSTAIRIDPRGPAARDALLARARRFVALGDIDRAREDLRRLQARTDVGPVQIDVDALAEALRAAGP